MLSIRIARRTLTAALPLAAALAITPAARAETLPPLGRAGQVVFDDLIGLRTGAPGYLGQLGYNPSLGAGIITNSGPGYSALIGYGHYTSSSTDPAYPSVASDSIWFSPAIDVFVAPRLSVGAALGLGYTWQTASEPPQNQVSPVAPNSSSLTLSAVPRVGYVFPIAPRLAIWPRIGVGYAFSRFEQRYQGTALGAASSMWLGGLDVKVVFQATRHVFFDAAPALSLRHVATDYGTYATSNFLVGMGGTVGMGVAL